MSQFIEPIYLSSIVLGMLYHNQHFKRAMYGRLEKCDIPHVKPMLAVTTNQPDRRAKNAPDFSVNWSVCDPQKLEMVNTSSGRLNDQTPSRLSKSKLFESYVECVAKVGIAILTRVPSNHRIFTKNLNYTQL